MPIEAGRTNEHKCLDCGRMYKHARNLDRHKKFECQREKKFHCPYCSYTGYQKVHVSAHIVRRHYDVQGFLNFV
ncbi:hypothetical protein HUJ05_008987 [Dendroctonus ponderosae]|nr:hypothetical protein HUJ05_008987 [Dendroctonus ponderosae]